MTRFLRSLGWKPLGLWLLLTLASIFTIGVLIYPIWWKRFLLGRGFLLPSFWADAFARLGRSFASFEPEGAALIGLCVVLLTSLVVFITRRSANVHTAGLLPAPPTTMLILAGVLSFLVFLSLFRVEGEYWTQAESMRRLDDTVRRVRDSRILYAFGVLPPASGIFLYIDSEKALEQYSVLSDALAVTAETMTEAGESKTGLTGQVPGVGSLGVEERKSTEKSVTRTAPTVTPAMAITRMIERFRFDENTVNLTESTLDSHEYTTIVEGLQKRGVTLSPSQKAQLEKAEVERFEEKAFRLKGRQPIFFIGKLSIVPGKTSAQLTTKVRHSTMQVTVSGRLKPGYLSTHIQHCFEEGKPSCDMDRVTLLAVTETIESPTPRTRNIVVLPLAIW